MKDKNIWGIIYLCVAINQKAIQVYTKLFEVEEIKELKVFWGRMADEEKIRAAFLDRTKETIKGYTLSAIFNDPAQTKYELTILLEKIDVLLDRWEDKKVMENALILVYRLEYYMLHPTFEMLFRALKPLADDLDSSDTYDLHIQEFINMFVRYGDITPELELLGETLQSLWQRNKDLAEIAMVDGLTGVLNRRGFLVIAHELFFLAQRKKENVAIFMIDIDHFKKINDQYGHPKGDAVLRGVAKSLKSNIRKSDVLCRYGGEEFVILFPHILASAVPHMAEKLRKGVEEARPKGIFVSISIGVEQGIVKYASDKTFFAWISKADKHLYEAKASGRNCVAHGC